MWGKVSCLRKQHDGRDWVSNHRPSDLKSNTLTTTPPRPPPFSSLKRGNNVGNIASYCRFQFLSGQGFQQSLV